MDDLTTLLHDAVEDVEPTDRLGAIRQRTRKPSRARWYAVGGALLATAAVVAGIAVAVRPGADPGPGPSDEPTVVDSASPSSHSVSVYDLGETPQGTRLFREFRREPGTSAEMDDVLAALSATPDDPDYHTLWPRGAFQGGFVDYGGGLITVLLTDRSLHDRPAGMTAEEAALSIEQVIYTVQAYAQQRLPVSFQVEGQPIDQVLGVRTAEPLAEGPELDVLALVSISNPAEGRVVEGGFSADGVASSFEGTVPWQLRNAAGDVVRRGFAQGTMEDHLTPWQTDTIDVSDLPAGIYTFAAMTDDPSGGAEGGGPTTDTRTITVR
jgi:hypothetical protein